MPRDKFSISWEYVKLVPVDEWRSEQYVNSEDFGHPEADAYAYITRENEKWRNASCLLYFTIRRLQLRHSDWVDGVLPGLSRNALLIKLEPASVSKERAAVSESLVATPIKSLTP